MTLQVSLAGQRGALQLQADFTLGAGVTALIGASGSGKSTLLRAIAGFDRFAGEIRLDGTVLQDKTRFLPPHLRPIGFVFQQPFLLPHLSVAGNLRYAIRRAAAGPEAAGYDDIVGSLGIAHLLERAPARLSGGERQRVALARALFTRPRILLMDEPMSGLDRPSKTAILPFLEAIFRRLAMPVLYVTHDPLEVARLASRRMTMRNGRLEQGETPLSARERLSELGPAERNALALAALEAGITAAPATLPDAVLPFPVIPES